MGGLDIPWTAEASTLMTGTPAGNTDKRYSLVCLSKSSHEGKDTTLQSMEVIYLSAHAFKVLIVREACDCYTHLTLTPASFLAPSTAINTSDPELQMIKSSLPDPVSAMAIITRYCHKKATPTNEGGWKVIVGRMVCTTYQGGCKLPEGSSRHLNPQDWAHSGGTEPTLWE